MAQPILIEGYTPQEILDLPNEQLAEFVRTDEPLVFKIGSAEILGTFRIKADRLIIELAEIEGGGEGVLPTLWVLAERYARQRGLAQVEWIVYAVHCAKPNPKLRPLLKRLGFVVENLPDVGNAYHYLHEVRDPGDTRNNSAANLTLK